MFLQGHFALLVLSLSSSLAAASEGDPHLAELFRSSNALVLGELHGTVQVPTYALAAIDAALVGERPTVLAIEIWSTEQKGLDAFLASDGTAADKDALLAGSFWRATRDGRSSTAMFELIVAARERVADKRPLRLVCFDDRSENTSGKTRDQRMAEFLLRDRAEHASAKYVVLAGNLHARTAIGARWDPEFVPMAHVLAAADPTLRSFNLRHSGGEFWVCTSPVDCGPMRFGGRGEPDARGLQLFDERDPQGFDGVFDIGSPEASPPAFDGPLNERCPRSGEAIVADSMTRYRGHVVGFCNTHCRDDFAGNVADRPEDTRAFDALIDELERAGLGD